VFDIPSVRIGKVFGIPLEVNLSWVVIFGLVAFALATAYYPSVPGAAGASQAVYWLLGIVTSLLFFASIIAHELCHALVTKAEGGSVEKITLFIFGGVAQIDEEPRSPGREFIMAASGPLMSLLIAGICFFAYVSAAGRGAPWWVIAPLRYLGSINLFVALFNMLPGFPLDGGRVLRSILWAATGDVLKATRWAARSGQVLGWAMVGLAVYSVLNGGTDFIWFGLVGWFIAWLAGSAYRQEQIHVRLEGVTVASIMTEHPEFVSGDITIERLANEHLLGGLHSRYPVIYGGAIVGIVSLADVKSVGREEWSSVRVIDVTNRDLPILSVSDDTPVEKVLARLTTGEPGAVLVVREGRLAGIVTRTDVLDLLRPSPK